MSSEMHVVEIELIDPSTYRVWYDDAVLVASSRNPEPDACIALAERGMTGRLVSRRRGSAVISLTMDIQKTATKLLLKR